MRLIQQGGAVANRSGSTLEHTVKGMLTGKGLVPVNYTDWLRHQDRYGQELLLCQVPYQSIYGHPAKTEFVVHSAKYQINARIECKWQASKGSVDEKFPYLFLNLSQQTNEPQVIIVLEGGGAKAGAVRWLSHACDSFSANSPRTLSLMSICEFMLWVNRTFV